MKLEDLLSQVYNLLNPKPGYYTLASSDIAAAINKVQIADGSAGTPLNVERVSTSFDIEEV